VVKNKNKNIIIAVVVCCTKQYIRESRYVPFVSLIVKCESFSGAKVACACAYGLAFSLLVLIMLDCNNMIFLFEILFIVGYQRKVSQQREENQQN